MLLLDLDEHVGTLSSYTDDSVPVTQVARAQPEPGTVEERMSTLARLHGRSALVDKLPYLYGQGRCPRCKTVFDIATALV